MKLVESEGGGYQISADGADPETVRKVYCSSCPVDHCPQMSDGGFAQIAMPRKKEDLEAQVQRLKYISENARCLKG